MGHGRVNSVTPGVASVARRARSFEEVAAPFVLRAAVGGPRLNAFNSSRRARWLALVLGCWLLSACAARPVEETVTVDASRLSALPAPAVAAATPQLPARDEDIEAAGDRIAEAITSLNRRRGPSGPRNPAAAQRALDQAAAALTRALRDKPHDAPVRDALRAALRDLTNSQNDIRRNAFTEAVAQLTSLNQRLDTLHGAEEEKTEQEAEGRSQKPEAKSQNE